MKRYLWRISSPDCLKSSKVKTKYQMKTSMCQSQLKTNKQVKTTKSHVMWQDVKSFQLSQSRVKNHRCSRSIASLCQFHQVDNEVVRFRTRTSGLSAALLTELSSLWCLTTWNAEENFLKWNHFKKFHRSYKSGRQNEAGNIRLWTRYLNECGNRFRRSKEVRRKPAGGNRHHTPDLATVGG